MPAVSPVMVVVVPVPVIPPGLMVQVPAAGSPLKITPPVATVHVGCVMAPTTGAVGAPIIFAKTEVLEAQISCCSKVVYRGKIFLDRIWNDCFRLFGANTVII